MSRRWMLLSAGLVLGLVSEASAGYRPFAFNYDTYPMAKGELEFEQWVTYKGHKGKEPGFTRIDFREELEYGLADNFTLGLYLPNWRYEDSDSKDGFEYRSVGVEGILYLSNPVTDALGVALYGEFTIGEEYLEFEQKLLLHKDIGNWTLAYNFIVETEVEGVFGSKGDTEVEGVLGHTVGVSYGLTSNFRLGAELIVESVFAGWTDYEGTTVYLGPCFSYQGSKIPDTDWNWWMTVTPTVQLTSEEGEPDFMVRMLFGIEF